MKTDNDSIAVQGIVGLAQLGVDQSFGSLTTTNNSCVISRPNGSKLSTNSLTDDGSTISKLKC